MSAEPHHPDPVETVGHERRDISIRAITFFLIGLEITMLLCCAVGYGLHRGYLHWVRSSMPVISPMADYDVQPPLPHLQMDPTGELQAYRQAQEALTLTYGWTDTASGIVRLPIERAKQLILERGLPARAKGSAS